jgi:hypothetical protein
MFRHFCVILMEFQNLHFTKLHKLLEIKLLELQFQKIITLQYYLVVTEWYSIVCATLQYLAKLLDYNIIWSSLSDTV